jgi:hypothetical protein
MRRNSHRFWHQNRQGARKPRRRGFEMQALALLGMAAFVGWDAAPELTSTWTLASHSPEQIDQAQRMAFYHDCDAARAAGAAPIYAGSPGYREELDGDLDGVACEPYRH